MPPTISIHAPLAGSDLNPTTLPSICSQFQSTLPLRGATGFHCGGDAPRRISIHAPLAGSDTNLRQYPPYPPYFNPRSPCGERQSSDCAPTPRQHFNPRSPCGERPGIDDIGVPRLNFNPRSPCGERLHKWTSKVHRMRQYLIHALESISSSPHIHFKMTCNQVLYL